MFNLPHLAQPSNEQKEAFLARITGDFQAREDLFTLLYTLHEFEESVDSSNFITELLQARLEDKGKDINEIRYEIRSLLTHLAFTRKIKEYFGYFVDNSAFLEECELKFKGEVGDE